MKSVKRLDRKTRKSATEEIIDDTRDYMTSQVHVWAKYF